MMLKCEMLSSLGLILKLIIKIPTPSFFLLSGTSFISRKNSYGHPTPGSRKEMSLNKSINK